MFKLSKNTDMTEGPLFSKIIVFAIPVVLTGILQLLYNAADLIVVGRFSESAALAAVGSTNSLVSLITSFAIGISTGSGVVMSYFYGMKDEEQIGACAHTSFLLGITVGAVFGAIGFAVARPMLVLMSAPAEVIDLSTLYIKIYFLGLPATMGYNFCAALLRSVGDTRRPLIYLCVSGLVNVALNLFFVIVFDMSVMGVALATVISQVVALAMILRYLFTTQESFRLHLKKMKIDLEITLRILKIGIPAGIQSSIFSISNMLVQSSINSFGKVVMSGNAAAVSIEGFVYISINSFYHAAITFTAQNMGAGKHKRVPLVLKNCLFAVTAVGAVLSWLVLLLGKPLLRIYIPNDEQAVSYGMVRLMFICSLYFTAGFTEVLTGVIRGLGSSVMPMISSIFGACVVRVIWILTVFSAYRTLPSLYIIYPISWIITSMLLYIGYKLVMHKNGWN